MQFINIIFKLCEILDIQNHQIAYIIKDGELSRHFSIPSLHTTLKTMRQLIKLFKEDEPELFEPLDLNVYTPYRWFRLPNQTLTLSRRGGVSHI